MSSRRVGCWLPALLGTLLVLGACQKKSTTGPSEGNQFLYEHNARFGDGRTVRWAQLPIPVFANGIAQEDEVAVWASESGGKVTFAFVGSAPGSGISFGYRSGSDICGVTTVEYDEDGVISSAEIRVSQSVYRGPQCQRTVTHETAHAIGFLDHTSDGGLMDDDGGDGRITKAVSRMFRDLYSMPPGTVVAFVQGLRTKVVRLKGRRTVTFVHPTRP